MGCRLLPGHSEDHQGDWHVPHEPEGTDLEKWVVYSATFSPFVLMTLKEPANIFFSVDMDKWTEHAALTMHQKRHQH